MRARNTRHSRTSPPLVSRSRGGFLHRLNEKEIRRVPQAGGYRTPRLAGQDDLEDVRVLDELGEEAVGRLRSLRLGEGQVAEHVVDDLTGRRHGRYQPRGAKLHHRVYFVEVPGQAGAERHAALEFVVRFRGAPVAERVEHQHYAPLVFAGELPHLERAGLGRGLPINEARAIGRLVFADAIEVVPATADETLQFAAHQRQNFV